MSPEIRKQFPILARKINGMPLSYLDNASTTQKPKRMLDALVSYYRTSNANIHRGIHTLSEESTELYEKTRRRIATFIKARPDEIIFTKNATESINCIASTWGEENIARGDEILVTILEHHANLVPWQELARRKRARLRIVTIRPDLTFDEAAFARLLSPRTKLVCVTAASNVLGVMPPLTRLLRLSKKAGARTLVDGAQSVGHCPTNVASLGCDFFVFSAHKMYGPTGVGVLFVKKDVMASLPPYQFGGDMVISVKPESAVYRVGPGRFEAGTPNIADIVAFHASLDFLEDVGMTAVRDHDQKLLAYAYERFSRYPAVRLFSSGVPRSPHIGVLSFVVDGIHAHDIATVFNSEGVAIRSGLHCAEPLVHALGVPATARMSFGIYNTEKDIDRADSALKKTLKIFKKT